MTADLRPDRSADVLRQIIQRETERLVAGILPWEWWLERAARYGQYGFGATLLISAQARFASEVRSYRGWQAVGRHVVRGEHGIRILSREGRPRAVFDVTQTEGRLWPAVTVPTSDSVVTRLRELLLQQGVSSRPDEPAEVLAHRTAHHLLHPGLSEHECRGVRRVEADSISFLVLTKLGLTPSGLVFRPPSEWAEEGASPVEVISAVGDRVLRTARWILRLLDALPAMAELAAMHTEAHRFFHARLPTGWAPDYLAARGFSAEVQDTWEIGFAPASGHALVDHLRALGHSHDAIVLAGLARRHPEGPRDMFRDRLMLPIRDPGGALVGFIGRRGEHGRGPKYLNSPETPLFRKSALLFGLYEARDALAAGARPVIVEGPLDAIAVNLAAPHTHAAVAPCGVQLSALQVSALAETADLAQAGVLVALDGDAAGRDAAVRAWTVLGHLPGRLDAVLLPDGRDPADLLRSAGPEAVRSALAAETPLADLVVDARIRRMGRLAFDGQRWAAARAGAEVIARLPADQIARQVVRLAGRLSIDPAIVTLAVASEISPVPALPAADQDRPSA